MKKNNICPQGQFYMVKKGTRKFKKVYSSHQCKKITNLKYFLIFLVFFDSFQKIRLVMS